jgi:YidC/Oxa1 family membrane protein insertase
MMGLWKKHKVNPGAAILPVLIQFPILIALFFVVKDGLMAYNSYLLYPIALLQEFDFSSIDFHFFYLNLSRPDPYFALPLLIGALQFWQMKSMMNKRKKKKKEKGEEKKKGEINPQESMMNMMTYFLPALIVVFSASLPSAVALYWGVSTVFAIGQQKLLQKKTQ